LSLFPHRHFSLQQAPPGVIKKEDRLFFKFLERANIDDEATVDDFASEYSTSTTTTDHHEEKAVLLNVWYPCAGGG
jgi:hypothetical protein